ncbi:MAG: hypothetical protein JSW61_10635 [Candidatus Thorarchaeota archaeon]|nr:MAG: hypothetical protein JSW61_10635 [Candidatus Thorarchaeota archaeon]
MPAPAAPPPRARRRSSVVKRSQATLGGFILWAAFVVVWLFFFAVGYGIFENIAVALSSFIIIAGFIAVMWTGGAMGPSGMENRARISILSTVFLIAFVILWLPFYAESFNVNKNAAVMLTSLLVFIGVNGAAWIGIAPEEARKEMGKRPFAGGVVFVLWLIFADYWFWFQADIYLWEYNIAILLLSVIVLGALEVGVFYSVTKRTGGEIKGVGLLFGWLIVLFVWFYFFAVPFNVYQNFAIVFVTFMIFAAIAALWGGRQWREIESLDWDD